MLGRALQTEATEDINVQIRRLGKCAFSRKASDCEQSLVFGEFGAVQSRQTCEDMEQAGKQGSLGPVSSHFLGGGSEGVLQDTCNHQLSLPETIPSLWRKGQVSPCVWAFVVISSGGIGCTFSQEVGLGIFDFSQ